MSQEDGYQIQNILDMDFEISLLFSVGSSVLQELEVMALNSLATELFRES